MIRLANTTVQIRDTANRKSFAFDTNTLNAIVCAIRCERELWLDYAASSTQIQLSAYVDDTHCTATVNGELVTIATQGGAVLGYFNPEYLLTVASFEQALANGVPS